MTRELKVGVVDVTSKCWVVRSGTRYRYVNQFLENNIIATGHLDNFSIDEHTFEEQITAENISHRLEDYNARISRNVKTQIDSFLIDMNIGDVVFTLTSTHVIPGIIRSLPFFSPNSFTEEEPFVVRRNVVWGDPIQRKDIPITIQKSFNAYQAVFSLGDNSKEVFHWLSSFFIDGDNYYSSLRVEQPEALKHHTLKQLAELIDRVQVLSIMISRHLEQTSVTTSDDYYIEYEDLKNAMEEYSNLGILDLTSQQVLMSPGDVWLKFNNSSKIAGMVFLYIMLTISSPAKGLEFSESTYTDRFPEIINIVDDNFNVLQHDLDIERIRRQLRLKAAEQNSGFVNSNNIEEEDYPDDGDAIHIGG